MPRTFWSNFFNIFLQREGKTTKTKNDTELAYDTKNTVWHWTWIFIKRDTHCYQINCLKPVCTKHTEWMKKHKKINVHLFVQMLFETRQNGVTLLVSLDKVHAIVIYARKPLKNAKIPAMWVNQSFVVVTILIITTAHDTKKYWSYMSVHTTWH